MVGKIALGVFLGGVGIILFWWSLPLLGFAALVGIGGVIGLMQSLDVNWGAVAILAAMIVIWIIWADRRHPRT
ncbi:MAG: hypothetical protein KJS79_09690 [Rhodospirillales bacterium]|nr:hypothetical protein [Rhodospirillales bacterium]MDE2327055.1 hypothetical protein [Rhodospirillales bacterium]